ncbi:MAG: radical SAM family heme chaperone HemW [Clostridia bacterium]|jgi:oxygen-independent coproporphyrinogen-3 oxidase|nr:radical SAM family heme chaperone HemW [Clostridia bacterium]
MKDLSLYIHIPFCKSKCYYCDFNSGVCSESQQKRYIDRLVNEIEKKQEKIKGYRVVTIYIGGGTPSVLGIENLEKLLSSIKNNIELKDLREYTIELNPGTITKEKIEVVKKYGINRVSLGLQTTKNELLKSIGRIHTYEEFKENYKMIKKTGIENISVDLMFSLPNQTIKDLEESIDELINLDVKHISCYGLTVEENTKFGKDNVSVDEEKDREMYWMMVNKLKKNSYKHYEISNFAKEGYESKHNNVYWKLGDYLGLGIGSHSFIDNQRYENALDFETYYKEFKRYNLENISRDGAISEYVFLGLRILSGISETLFKEKFGVSIYELYNEEINQNIKKGLLKKEKGNIMLTDKGIDYSNMVFTDFI